MRRLVGRDRRLFGLEEAQLIDAVDQAVFGEFVYGKLDLAQFEGASSGLLGQDDYDEASAALQPGASAAILLYENSWAAPFVAAMRRSGAQVVANGRIPVEALMEVLEEIESANA